MNGDDCSMTVDELSLVTISGWLYYYSLSKCFKVEAGTSCPFCLGWTSNPHINDQKYIIIISTGCPQTNFGILKTLYIVKINFYNV